MGHVQLNYQRVIPINIPIVVCKIPISITMKIPMNSHEIHIVPQLNAISSPKKSSTQIRYPSRNGTTLRQQFQADLLIPQLLIGLPWGAMEDVPQLWPFISYHSTGKHPHVSMFSLKICLQKLEDRASFNIAPIEMTMTRGQFMALCESHQQCPKLVKIGFGPVWYTIYQ